MRRKFCAVCSVQCAAGFQYRCLVSRFGCGQQVTESNLIQAMDLASGPSISSWVIIPLD
jgi:hypothetical protein